MISVPGPTLVRFPRFVGDAVMHLPILRLLRQQMYIWPIGVWGPAATLNLVADREIGLVDFVIPETEKIGAIGLSKIIKNHNPDTTICFTKSLRPVIAARLANVPERIGISDSGAFMLNTHHAPFRKTNGHFILRYYNALKKRWPNIPAMPYADYQPTAQVEKPRTEYICLMPGSVWPSKAWPPEHYRELADKARQSGLQIVILGTSSEAQLGDYILNGRGLNLCGQTDLSQAAAWLHGAYGAIGNDSGLSHLAAACGTQTIAIFGPTDPQESAPWGQRVTVIKLQLKCSPCFKRKCPLPCRNCMMEITPRQVWDSLQ
ncbi:MAG: lipopolysaccharide heptosyltransferase II [Holophagaceae bacterium]|nr:lipopolysaccharide heptosyltransferase II [Holophagaceae bacterium]